MIYWTYIKKNNNLFFHHKCSIKSHIIDELSKIKEAKYYIPDDVKPSLIIHEYSLTVSNIFNI